MSDRIIVGTRVRMDTNQTIGFGLDRTLPDLGLGTVAATECEGLMVGFYVEVDWDEGHRGTVRYPAIGSLIAVVD